MGHRDTSRAHGWGLQPRHVPRPLLSPCCEHGTWAQGGEILPEAPKAQPMPFPYFCAKENRNFGEILKRPCEMPNRCCAWAREIPPPCPPSSTGGLGGSRSSGTSCMAGAGLRPVVPPGAVRCHPVMTPGAVRCHPEPPGATQQGPTPALIQPRRGLTDKGRWPWLGTRHGHRLAPK